MEEVKNLLQYLLDRGWTVTQSKGTVKSVVIYHPVKDVHIWQFIKGWQVADRKPLSGFCNHRPEKTLKEAIDKN